MSLDCGAFYRGYHGDAATTVGVGQIDPAAQKMIDVGWESLCAGIQLARAGNRLGDISAAIQAVLEAQRLRRGARPRRPRHRPPPARARPMCPTSACPGRACAWFPAWSLAIEPMLTQGSYEGRTLADDWTIVTRTMALPSTSSTPSPSPRASLRF